MAKVWTDVFNSVEPDQFSTLTDKPSPVSGDLIVLEDSAASGAKKKGQVGNLPFDSAGAAAAVQGNLDTHEANSSNPHSVTAVQAGAEPDLGNPTSDGDVLSSTIAGVRSWITPASGGDLTNAVFPTYAVFDAEVDNGSLNPTVNFATGNKQRCSAATVGNITLQAPGIGSFILRIIDSTTHNFSTSVRWDSGTPPSWAGESIVALYWDGTNWSGAAMVGVAS